MAITVRGHNSIPNWMIGTGTPLKTPSSPIFPLSNHAKSPQLSNLCAVLVALQLCFSVLIN